jgi:hypothetical protein
MNLMVTRAKEHSSIAPGVIETDAASRYLAHWLLPGQRHDRPAGAPSPARLSELSARRPAGLGIDAGFACVELILALQFDKAHPLV